MLQRFRSKLGSRVHHLESLCNCTVAAMNRFCSETLQGMAMTPQFQSSAASKMVASSHQQFPRQVHLWSHLHLVWQCCQLHRLRSRRSAGRTCHTHFVEQQLDLETRSGESLLMLKSQGPKVNYSPKTIWADGRFSWVKVGCQLEKTSRWIYIQSLTCDGNLNHP